MSGRAPRNRVRIVGGQWRSRLLAFPGAAGLRPTPDRVRETVFNWLGQDLTGKRCLDLYAGSGALGFEAASRNAQSVVMVERDARAMQALQENRTLLGAQAIQLRRADALEFLAADTGIYDVVFADPPYAAADRETLLQRIRPRLAAHAVVYLEAPASFDAPAGWQLFRGARAGAVHYRLLRTELL